MRNLAVRLLLCMLAASPHAHATEVLVAASQDSPALQRFVAELAGRRPQDQVRFLTVAQLPAPTALPADSRLILLGADTLPWRLTSAGGPPTLVLQISRVQAYRRLSGHHPPRLTLLWSDPPPARQLQLIRQLLPQARRVGLVYSNASRFLVREIRQQAAAQGLALRAWYWPDPQDSRTLNRMLEESDVVLGLDDPALYNSATIKGVLLASYSRRLALIGPTAAFIRAGSLSSTFSDQQDWLDELDRLLSRPPQEWPREAYPSAFKVLGNPQVARSLGIEAGDDRDQARSLLEWEQRR
ncbi:ABC transporter substrate binding protein [Pseudomonas sp. GCM10022188]|uniref:ABC transporter substrate binding protein n=1 Tax=Pseudomonas TaxID=286 RepID=UPI001E41CDFF|nr:ABC transporter substrate binding protein [Pseudomonas oryzagri]MCC6077339.1 ABC transporter substrate-binding protein [Pseudomonas oryzagri]